MSEVKIGSDSEVEEQPIDNGYTVSIHSQIDPILALPVHLQKREFEEDIWRRMVSSKFRNPSLTTKNLREDPEKRDLLRGAISAASEREKEVLMHNQARVFTGILQSVAKSVQHFLNEPIAPQSWRAPPSLPKDSDQDADNQGADAYPVGIKGMMLFFLTPKVFLTIVALGFGVLAGYSQIQVQNLNATIESYE